MNPTINVVLGTPVGLTKEQEAKLCLALDMCCSVGRPWLRSDVVVVDELAQGELGFHAYEKIYLSVDVLSYGVRCVAGTILREHWLWTMEQRSQDLSGKGLKY